MIKKIIGVVCTLAILAIILFTILGAGSYRTMLPDSVYEAIGLTVATDDVANVQE